MKHQKRTRLLSALLALALLLAFVPQLPIAARAAETADICGKNLTWRFDEDSGVLTVTGRGAMFDYDYDDDPPWSPYREKITSVALPQGLTSIGDWAFYGCTELASVTIPDSVTSIGIDAFSFCEKLEAIHLPEDIIRIGTAAFEECAGLSEITFPEGLMIIGNWAFMGCGGLEQIFIPASVIDIGEKAFLCCDKMKEIRVDPKNPEFCSEDGVLFTKDKSQLIRIPDRKSGSYRIPDTVRMIDYSALTNCAELESITLPAGVEHVEVTSFLDCSKLKEILISPESSLYVSLDGVLFSRDMTKLIRFPAGRTGEYRIPEGVRTVCSDAFESSALTSVTLPESVAVVGNAAFEFCPNLKTFSFPAGVREIGGGALYCCDALERVTVWNPECSIDNDLIMLSDDETVSVPVLCGYRGSTLAEYAEENGLPFEEIESKTGFADVKDDAYYADPIAWAVAQDVTTGVTPYYFSPDKTCTRAQAVTFLWRARGCPEPTLTDNPFVDVKPDQYDYNAVLWAVENGVTNGLDDTHFGPDKGCTRAQVVTFLWRSEGKPDAAGLDDPFTDVASDQYYTEPVLWAVEKGITKGAGPDKFSPDSTCTRAQIVTFLSRDMK